MLTGHDASHDELSPADTMWKAVRAITDAVMGLDDAQALAAAKGNMLPGTGEFVLSLQRLA